MITLKKIIALLCVFIGCSLFCACSKDQILGGYDSVIQLVRNTTLTNDIALKGERKYGNDHYTGTYKAEYKDFPIPNTYELHPKKWTKTH